MATTETHEELTPSELTPQVLYDKCVALARNLWWSWQADLTNIFRELDPIRWRQLQHNPIALLAEFTPERSAERIESLYRAALGSEPA